MTLYELTQNITLQGDIKVTRFDANLNTETRIFIQEDSFDVYSRSFVDDENLTDWEDLEVTFMFASTSGDGEHRKSWLNIEVSDNEF